jgi:hypothetical protein
MTTTFIKRVPVVLIAAASVAAAAYATQQPQRFTLTGNTIHGVDQPMRVTASGPISGGGGAVDRDNPDGKTGTLTFTLPLGKVIATNRATSLATHPNPRACVAKIVERGTFAIVRGTRHYAGVHGSGTYVRNSKIVGARDATGRCLARSKQPAAVYNVVTMTGTVSIG